MNDPKDLSFATINDWLTSGPPYEDVEDVCLTLAAALERASGKSPIPPPVDLIAAMDAAEEREGADGDPVDFCDN